ncbi:hypothetical protein BLNAU_4051 [Blattamonas nauphoetae]|uniref:Uncharacterized protein n=1 Tax=Blattamonas nauphoetae TaxID=2049346 RepID=A0ABQ9YBH5_9EUKA|nr:hypothetical protein BLNAU_4051 [Blattamonas nauphoetae]
MESLFFKPEIVDSLFWRHKDLIISTFTEIRESTPPFAVLTTLARLSLFPHLRIAFNSIKAQYSITERDPPALTLLPSPIFPSSSPSQQCSGLSFLTALTKTVYTVFSEFQTNIPTDPSRLPKYVQITKDDQFIVTRNLNFCEHSFLIPTLLLIADPPIKVDSEIIRELVLFVKEALPTILTNISNVDTLIASLPSDSSPTTPLVSEVDTQMRDSLKLLQNACEDFVDDGWRFFVNLTANITAPHKSTFQTIILDDPSFVDLILNTLTLPDPDIREKAIMSITNIIYNYPSMKQQFMTANLIGRMLETLDLVSLPLSESKILFQLTKFIANMCDPIGDDEETGFEQYPLIRVSVFEPVKQFIIFLFNNSDTLILDEEDEAYLENQLCWIHNHITNMELRSDEQDADIVSELVKWEGRAMVAMENEHNFDFVFQCMLDRTQEWSQDNRERQKRREVLLREEGWDDAFEQRGVGIEADLRQNVQDCLKQFRVELAFNADEL